MIRNSTTSSSRIDLQVGLGYGKSFISMEQDYDVNLYAPSGGATTTTIALSSDQIRLNAPNSYTNNLVVTGSINGNNGLNIGFKLPISFSCYDIDLTKYVKFITLDGYNIRQFRLRSWLSDADFQGNNSHQLRYDIIMSNRGGLSIYAMAVPFDNEYLDNSKWADHFYYRNDFNRIMYCSRFGTPKVYCIIEDLL